MSPRTMRAGVLGITVLLLALPAPAVAAERNASATQYVGGGGGDQIAPQSEVQGITETSPDAESITEDEAATAPSSGAVAGERTGSAEHAAPVTSAGPSATGTLPFTGGSAGYLGALGLALLVAGLTLAVLTRDPAGTGAGRR